jgi:LPXTG-motif cell wall-anchored protein
MPVSGSDTLLLTLIGTMLLSAGGGLVLLARRDHAGRLSAVSTNMGGPRGRND